MKILCKSLLAFALILLSSITYAQPETKTICAGRFVPPGWVQVGTTTSYNECGNNGSSKPSSNNMWIIENTAGQSSVVVCAGTTLPEGWVVVNTQSNATCLAESLIPAQNQYNNAWTIKNTAGQTSIQVCTQLAPLPEGWVASQYQTNASTCLPKSSTGIYDGVANNVAIASQKH